MIARGLLQPGVIPVALLTVAVLALWFVRHGLRLRRRVEFERNLLELLHLATRREHALAPLLRRAAIDADTTEQKWFERIATELENGSALHEALSAGARKCIAADVLAAIASAEGTAQLPNVLADLARRRDRSNALRYQVLLAASYPALLSLLLVCLGAFWAMAGGGPGASGLRRFDVAPWAMWIATICTGTWLLLAFGWGTRSWTRTLAVIGRNLPWLGSRLRLLPAARAMRTCASLVASGASLPTALHQSAHVSADPRSERHLHHAAELADSGSPTEEVWQQSGLPAFAIARLACGSTSREQLASHLTELAEQCDLRCSDSIQRATAVLQPIVVLGFGVVVALQFSDLFTWIDGFREQAMEQLPW